MYVAVRTAAAALVVGSELRAYGLKTSETSQPPVELVAEAADDDDAEVWLGRIASSRARIPVEKLPGGTPGGLFFNRQQQGVAAPCSVIDRTMVPSGLCDKSDFRGRAMGFIVTGAGRSGTLVLTELLKNLTFRVRHWSESEPGPWGPGGRGEDGAVSWIHSTFSPQCDLPPGYFPVRTPFKQAIMVTRHPLDQIASRAAHDWVKLSKLRNYIFCGQESEWPEWRIGTFANFQAQELGVALRHYVLQSSFTERYASQVFRIEDVVENPQLLNNFCPNLPDYRHFQCKKTKLLETLHDLRSAASSLESRDLTRANLALAGAISPNSGRRTTTPTTWAELALIDSNFTSLAQILAMKFGYLVPDDEVLQRASDHIKHHGHDFDCDWVHSDVTLARDKWNCKLGK